MQESVLCSRSPGMVYIQRAKSMNTHILSLLLSALGIVGTAALVTIAGIVMWSFGGTGYWGFGWNGGNGGLLKFRSLLASSFWQWRPVMVFWARCGHGFI